MLARADTSIKLAKKKTRAWVADGGMFVFYNTDNEKPITLDELKATLKENNIDYNALCSGSNMKSCGGGYRA